MSPWLWAVALPVVVAYAASLGWVFDNWFIKDSYYSHGPLLPLLAVFLVWRQWGALRALPGGADARGWWLLGPALFLHLCAAALTVDSLSAASLCLAIPGAVLLGQGAARWRRLLPILGLIVFAIPTPMFVTGRAVFVLKEVAVFLGISLANLFGAGVTRSGADILVPGAVDRLVVADACGGLRSLVALVTVGYVITFIMGSARWRWRFVMLALALPIAIGSNVLRIAAMCLMSRWFGVEFGSGTGHDIANAVVWLLALGAMLGLDHLFSRHDPVPGGSR